MSPDPSQDLAIAEYAFRTGNAALAERLLAGILAAQPSHSRAHELMAYIAGNRGVMDDVFRHLSIATASADATPSAWYYLGVWLAERRRPAEALDAYRKSLALGGDFVEALHDLGVALHELDRHDEALACFDRALALNPRHAASWCNRGSTLHDSRRFDEALADYGKALACEPDHADARWNQSLTQLILGRYEQGWPGYEYRWKGVNPRARRNADLAPWRGGESVAGKRVLVWGEQGFGDTIQFARYVPMLARLGAEVVLEVRAPIAELMRSVGDCTVVVQGENLPPCDYEIPVGSLPLAFATTLSTLPATVPYLSIDAPRVEAWRQRLRCGDGRLKIGLACSGNAAFRYDRHRPIPLAELAVLRGEADLFLLQTEVRDGDRACLADPASGVTDLGENFQDTAAIVSAVALVISVDTALAHLAGALGRPVWVLLPWVPDWRWLAEGDRCPWYPSVTLIRQQRLGDWSGVMDAVKARLAAPRR